MGPSSQMAGPPNKIDPFIIVNHNHDYVMGHNQSPKQQQWRMGVTSGHKNQLLVNLVSLIGYFLFSFKKNVFSIFLKNFFLFILTKQLFSRLPFDGISKIVINLFLIQLKCKFVWLLSFFSFES